MFSKWVEMGDTLFIVLRKKPLIFLHYYHHVSTAIFCFITTTYYYDANFAGMWFAAINSFVHTLMYWYFFRASTHYGSPKWGFYLTLVQISQMVVGACVMLYTARCENFVPVLFGYGSILYASFFALFFQLFYKKHYADKAKKAKKAAAGKKTVAAKKTGSAKKATPKSRKAAAEETPAPRRSARNSKKTQ